MFHLTVIPNLLKYRAIGNMFQTIMFQLFNSASNVRHEYVDACVGHVYVDFSGMACVCKY